MYFETQSCPATVVLVVQLEKSSKQVVYWFKQGSASELSPEDKQVEYDVAQLVLQSALLAEPKFRVNIWFFNMVGGWAVELLGELKTVPGQFKKPETPNN